MNFTHVIATRNGLFLANTKANKRVADGHYYGVTVRAGYLYCFQAVQHPTEDGRHGRIVRFKLEEDTLGQGEIMFVGLHGGVHQIDFVGDRLFAVDTYRQQIVEIDEKWESLRLHYPLPPIKDRDSEEYAHINSFLFKDDRFYIMMHNMGRKNSEILVTDAAFAEIAREPIQAQCGHDLVPLEDGRFLFCNSMQGELVLQDGPTTKVDALFTRGLSINQDEVVVGSSLFGERIHRDLLPGFVTFMDRDFRRTGRHHIQSSPTQIRRLDGRDYSLSNYHLRTGE